MSRHSWYDMSQLVSPVRFLLVVIPATDCGVVVLPLWQCHNTFHRYKSWGFRLSRLLNIFHVIPFFHTEILPVCGRRHFPHPSFLGGLRRLPTATTTIEVE